MIIAAVGDGAYKFVLALHILTAVIGVGGLAMGWAYDTVARRQGGQAGAAILDADLRSGSSVPLKALYVLPFLGIALVVMSDDFFSMGDVWVSASFVVYVAIIGVYHGMIRPARKMVRDMMLTGGSAGESEAVLRRATTGTWILNGLLVVALYLMIWKPGL